MAEPEALVVVDKVPQAFPLQPAPLTDHVTPLFCESFCTLAVTDCVLPTCTEDVAGETLTLMAGGGGAAVTVKVAIADFVVSVMEMAVMVTVAGDGTLEGAV